MKSLSCRDTITRVQLTCRVARRKRPSTDHVVPDTEANAATSGPTPSRRKLQSLLLQARSQ